ncbi:hypothetical protein [Kribbella sp. NPDC048915]|uniref:hypothetical protein n=1 Tax=Kribbella sp. NPDC048915 TaxID=3155148 RepID=UPI0033F28EC2
MCPEWYLLRPPCDRSAHDAFGVFVLPGGVVGLLPWERWVVVGVDGVVVVVVVVVAVGELVRPGGIVVPVVGGTVGTIVGVTVDPGVVVTGGAPVGVVLGGELVSGVSDGVRTSVVSDRSPAPGRGVFAAISAGGAVGRCFGCAASGSGMKGVSIRGPPSKLLAMSAR